MSDVGGTIRQDFQIVASELGYELIQSTKTVIQFCLDSSQTFLNIIHVPAQPHDFQDNRIHVPAQPHDFQDNRIHVTTQPHDFNRNRIKSRFYSLKPLVNSR